MCIRDSLRSESMLDHFGVTEENWRDAGKKDSNFLQSESPLFVGRAIAALATDPKGTDRTGMLFGSWELGRDYKVSDYDGRRPDWGRHKIDFSVLPAEWTNLFLSLIHISEPTRLLSISYAVF